MSKCIVLVVTIIGVIAMLIIGDPANKLFLTYHNGELVVRTMDEDLPSDGALTTPHETTSRHSRSEKKNEDTL